MKQGVIVGYTDDFDKLYNKVRQDFYIQGIYTNDSNLIGTKQNDLKVYPIEKLNQIKVDEVFIFEKNYKKIFGNIFDLGIVECIIFKEGFLYRYDSDYIIKSLNWKTEKLYNKKSENSILFVQDKVDDDSYRLAKLLKNRGWDICLAFFEEMPEYSSLYDEVWPINDINEFCYHIINSQYDIVQCSYKLDFLTNLLFSTNKKIIRDTRETQEDVRNLTSAGITTNYIAATYVQGIVCSSEETKKHVQMQYVIKEDKIHVFNENLIRAKENEQDSIDRLVEFYQDIIGATE